MTKPARLLVRVAPAPGAPGAAPITVGAAGPGTGDGPAWEVDGRIVPFHLERRGPARAVCEGPDGRSELLVLPRMHDTLHGSSAWPGRVLLEIVIDGWRLDVTLEDAARAALRARATRGRSGPAAETPAEVRAIIPGRVAAVLVEAGESVAAGQALLVVEAMKMQNELRAPRSGTAARIGVVAGQTVEAGALLVVIE